MLASVLVVGLATSASAQPAAPVDDQGEQLRHQIYLMEGALARAVTAGASRLNQEFRAVMPDMMVVAGDSNARGFHLAEYGVFFDVEVPVLRQSVMWSLRTMLDQDDQGAAEALASLRTLVASTSGPERAKHEAALRRLEAQLRPFAAARRAETGAVQPASSQGTTVAAQDAAGTTPRKVLNQQLLDDPNKAYTDAVVKALIDAMVDYSLPMVSALRPEEYLTVAARDNERRDLLAPPNPYEQVSTFTLRIKAADLAAYRAGKIDRDEARKRVQVQEF
ncbi:MAG: hypothetical protein ABI880_12300 [Acidobacteriota bacterium]